VALDPANKQWHDSLDAAAAGIGGLAFKLLLAHDMTDALAAADQSISLAPDQIWLYTNRAHALMFLGRIDEATGAVFEVSGSKGRVVGRKTVGDHRPRRLRRVSQRGADQSAHGRDRETVHVGGIDAATTSRHVASWPLRADSHV